MLSNHPNCLGGNGPSASSDLIGDVDGPASATDNAVARFDGTTGKLIQNSAVTIDDTGNITAPDLILGASGPSAKSSIAARAARQGLVFDGTANGPDVTQPAFGSADFTLATWVRVDSLADQRPLFSGASGNFYAYVATNGSLVINKLPSGNVTSTANVTAGKISLVVYTRATSGGVSTGTWYIDGVSGGSGTDASNYTTAINAIGKSGFFGKYLVGSVSPVGIYNRALSAAEVVSLYEAGVPAGADYNTASNTNLATTTVVASGGTLSGESATGFTMTSASGVAYVGTRPTFGATTTGLAGVAPVGSRWLVTFTATLTSGAAPSLSILQTNSFASISNTATVTAGSNSVVLTTTANGTWVVCPTFYTASASTYTISAITVTRQGLLLSPDAAQSGGALTWYDTSGNAANITLPATGVSWNVPTSGRGIFADGTAAAPSISFAAEPSTGWYRASAGTMALSLSGTQRLNLFYSSTIVKLRNTANNNEIGLVDAGAVQITAAGTNQNITLTPSGTGGINLSSGNPYADNGITTLHNSTSVGFYANLAGQAMRFYTGAGLSNLGINIFSNGRVGINTTTDSVALLQIGTNTTTSAGGMVFGTDVSLYRQAAETLALDTATSPTMLLRRAGVNRLGFQSTATDNYIFTTTAASLILQTNFTAALTLDSSQNATFAGAVGLPATGNLYWSARASLKSPANGIVTLYNDAGTDFSRLQFGGTTSSFPALKRNGVRMDVVLADASDDAVIRAKTFLAAQAATTAGAGEISYGSSTAATVGAAGGASALPATPTGYIIVNVAGTNMKVPYYAN